MHQKQKNLWNSVICLMIPLGHTSIKIIVFNTLFFFIFLYFRFNLLIFLIRSYLDSGGVKGKVNIFLYETQFLLIISENTKQISITVTD